MRILQRSVGVFLLLAVSASAKIITVNTTNNVSPGPGETNLVQAISLLQDGDSIHFNIPGAGPFYLITPPLTPDNGYPLITNNNITIDGYSQPGSSPNSDPILSSNNAQIEIVIDSRAGGANEEQIPGFVNESGAFFVVGATNFTVRGISFLGSGFGYGAPEDPYRYAIALGLGASGAHVNGCWFGLDPNGHDVYPFRDAIAGFQGDPGVFINDVTFGVDKDAPDAATARAQFNIMIGEQIPVIIEGNGLRISGNFFNVFPDGMTDYNATLDQPLEAFIEAGFPCGNFLLGTDSDGNNDSEERNIFGGITVANDRKAIEFYGSGLACTNGVVAGNYFGVAVDGVTRFTNSITILSSFPPTTTFRIGSDLDGVEDELEANLFSDNYPFDYFFPPDFLHAEPVFSGIAAGSRISFRGNQCIGDNIAPLTWVDGNGDYLKKLTNVYSHFVLVTNAIMPTLDDTSSQGILRGTCPLGLDPYTNVVVDLYLADQESWTNGQKLQLEELAYYDPVTAQTEYYGFPNGKTYLGSFTENGPQDLDPQPGRFAFNISSLGLPPGAMVTVAANYSPDAPGTHDGRVETTVFAMPVNLQAAPELKIFRLSGSISLSWPTSAGMFTIQSSPMLPATWTDLDPQPSVSVVDTNFTATIPAPSAQAFYRLAR